MIQALIQAFQQGGLDWTDDEIADAVWLASYIDLPSKENFETKLSLGYLRANDSVQGSIPQPTQPSKVERDTTQKTEPATKPIQPTAEVHLPQPKSEMSDSVKGLRGVSFHVPAATALPGKLALARSLRPLLRRVPSRTISVLDEEATVQSMAEVLVLSPVLKPGKERWLELAVVIDDWATMCIWNETIAELMELLHLIGAFRTIRTYRLATELRRTKSGQTSEHAQLFATRSSRDKDGRISDPKELFDPQGRGLILLVSDCTSPIWSNGKMNEFVKILGKENMVALVQMLPPSLWEGCALANAIQVYLSARIPGQPNSKLISESLWHFQNGVSPSGYSLPVFTLEPDAIAVWSNLVSGKADMQPPGFYLSSRSIEDNNSRAKTDNVPLTAEEKLQRFRATASPTARKLAGYLSAAPLSLSVMHLLQKEMPLQSNQVHLAEVVRSGLIRQVTSKYEDTNPNEIHFEFIDGVRELLLATVPLQDSFAVLEKTAKYISQHTDSLRTFHALIADPDSSGEFIIDDDSLPLATVALTVFQRLGGRFTDIVKRLTVSLGNYREVQSDRSRLAMLLRQRKILEFLVNHISNHGSVPSVNEIAAQVNTSLAAIHQELSQLEYLGLISISRESSKEIEVNWPLVYKSKLINAYPPQLAISGTICEIPELSETLPPSEFPIPVHPSFTTGFQEAALNRISRRQLDIIEFIHSFFTKNNYPPNIREIGEKTSITSTSVTNYNLNKLEQLGFLTRNRQVSRDIQLNWSELYKSGMVKLVPSGDIRDRNISDDKIISIPVLGKVGTEIPIPIFLIDFSDSEDALSIPKNWLQGSLNDFYGLRVVGDGMIDAGLFDGDIVILKRQETAVDGDIVAVQILGDDEYLLAYFQRKDKMIRLLPANEKYSPIERPADRIIIKGKVVRMVRLFG